jgi:hydrogenase/urease accessory protein HupE
MAAPTETTAAVDPEPISAADAQSAVPGLDLHSLGEFRLTAIIFIFGLIALFVFYLILRNRRATPFVLRMYIIIILVFGTLLIVSSAYTTAQIAPVVGFFGTIAGYLLGRTERPGAGDDRSNGGSDTDESPR